MLTNDNLILSAGLNDVDNSIHIIEDISVRFGFIFEFESQPSDTVCERVDIFFAADIFNNIRGELLILSSHGKNSSRFEILDLVDFNKKDS